MEKIFTIFICFISIITSAQTTIKIEAFGSITLPNEMEIQGGEYKNFVNNVKKINGVEASNVIFQQEGLNDGNSGFDTYARVMIKTSYGDFNSLNTPITSAEVNEINNIFESQIKNEAYQNNAMILSWIPAKATTLNGNKSIKFGYKRKINTNPTVFVETFIIQNSDKMYTITFESRTDSYNWASKFLLIKNSIKINKK